MRIWLCLLFVAVSSAQEATLAGVKRVYVEKLTGGSQADQLRDMIIASLHRAGVFALTGDRDRADAVLKGSAEDTAFTDTFESSDSITGRTGANLGSTGVGANTRRAGSSTVAIGDRESTKIQERKHEASASVRLVNREGDVIWSTTQESLGAKFRSASADVAERITKQLVADLEKLRAPKPANANPLPR